MTKSSKDPSSSDREPQGLHTTFAVPSNTPPEENRAPETNEVLKKKFPPMSVEQDGNKIYAHMEYNGTRAAERVPLQYLYMTSEEKKKFLRVNKIVNKLLKKVGFEY